jgi:ketosteroid isomerase-like protein
MKVMTRVVLAAVMVAILGAWAAQAAEKWTAEQKEILAIEEKLWSLNKPTDVTEMLTYYHPDYMGWDNDAAVPGGKDGIERWMTYYMSTGDMIVHEIRPVHIWVKGNYAFIDYYYAYVVKDKKGEDKFKHGRWTDIFVKENGKWLCIGDHGGESPSK